MSFLQFVRHHRAVSVDDLDADFFEKMEVVSGCKLPLSLKLKISNLIVDHTFNCGVSLNMDINSLGNVSKEFQDMFAKLLRHVCTVDVRTKDLVLHLMEAIAQADPTVDCDHPSAVSPNVPNVAAVISDISPEKAKSDPPNVCLHFFF